MNAARTPMGRPMFIIGCERSGTTLLRAMLNAHPHIAIPYEAQRFSKLLMGRSPWTQVWSRDEAIAPIQQILANPRVSFWAPTPAQVLYELDGQPTIRYDELLRAIYAAHARRERKSRWGDKTPRNTFDLPHLITAFPDAQFLHIVRDGRDVYRSWATVDWAGYDVATAAKRWTQWVGAADEPGEGVGPQRYHVLRYEELIEQPLQVLQRVCHFLGEAFSDRMLHYHEQQGLVPEEQVKFHTGLTEPLDASRVQRWKHAMSPADVATFERIAGPTLVKYGYELTHVSRTIASLRLGWQRLWRG